MGADDALDAFDLRTWHRRREVVVVFHAELLFSAQCGPTVLDHVVEVAPPPDVVELTGRVGADAPYAVEELEGLHARVALGVRDGLDRAGLPPFRP